MRTSLATSSLALCVCALSAVAVLLGAPARAEPPAPEIVKAVDVVAGSSPIPCGTASSARAARVRLYREHLLAVEGPRALLELDPAGEQGPVGRTLCMYSRTYKTILAQSEVSAQR